MAFSFSMAGLFPTMTYNSQPSFVVFGIVAVRIIVLQFILAQIHTLFIICRLILHGHRSSSLRIDPHEILYNPSNPP